MIWPVSTRQQREALAKMWPLFPVGLKNPIHLRAICGKGVPDPQPVKNITFTASRYPSVTDRQLAFTDTAIELNIRGYNIYTCFNPINPDFKGDEHNGLSVKDSDIACRRYLLVDFDRVQTSQPATDDEIDEVFAAASALERDIFSSKGHEPITINSGNGAHIYLPVEMPNDGGSKTLCQLALQTFAAKYDTETVKVDTGVYNASRITKVPGTIARKGIEVPDDTGFNERRYRMAKVVK